MKIKVLLLVTLVVISGISCSDTSQKDFVTFSGTITNPVNDTLKLISFNRSKKPKFIKVNADGTFKDTLSLNDSMAKYIPNYVVGHGKEISYLYLKNGYDLQMTLNPDQFDETIAFSGAGSAENNYLVEGLLLREKEREEEKKTDIKFLGLPKEEFERALETKIAKKMERLTTTNGLDSLFFNKQKESIENLRESFRLQYKIENNLLGYQEFKKRFGGKVPDHLKVGKPSPVFEDYENITRGTVSLTDFKGKYVYVDIWATWCGPCKMEIPHLKKVEEAYHEKNIAFVSISVDKEKQRKSWEKMVEEKSLGGVQLFADKSFKSDFIKKYQVQGIPRFILIDPNGNIVDSNAPRPSYRLAFDEMLQNAGI
nr:TlpA disulfide reductase family protein [Allomuricauda sp.]